MDHYNPPSKDQWNGRTSDEQRYLHEKIRCTAISKLKKTKKTFALLGYACDEGVARNQGRIGAKNGPNAIRKELGKMPNHLASDIHLLDVGDIVCVGKDLDNTQQELAKSIAHILDNHIRPIVLGGGHDMSYGHFNGIKNHLISKNKRPNIGIINFDAHFDLRETKQEANSGTPFFQIANENDPFHYLCLGIRKDANDSTLFQTARSLEVTYVESNALRIQFSKEIKTWVDAFMAKVKYLYVTIDLDGFSSAYAPGVSSPSPMGFSPDIVLETLETILASGKVIGLDIAEMNPKYDIDQTTAKLAASLIHKVIHSELQ